MLSGYYVNMYMYPPPPLNMDKDGAKTKMLWRIILVVEVMFSVGRNSWIVLCNDGSTKK